MRRPVATALDELDPRWYVRLYDLLGERYDDLPFTKGTKQEVDFLLGALGLEPEARILDVGCGTARHAVELAALGFPVTGVDLSLRLLEVGLARARERGVLVNLMHADARDLRPQQAFDVVLSLGEGAFGLLEDDEENRRVLARLRGAVRDGGRLVLNVHNRAHREANPESFPGHELASGFTVHAETMTFESGRTQLVRFRDRAFHADEIRAEVEAHGFDVDAVHGCRWGAFGPQPVLPIHPELLLLARAR